MNLEIHWTDGQFIIGGTAAPIREISSWVGWRRTPAGNYYGSPWASTVLAVQTEFPGYTISWSAQAKANRDHLLSELRQAKGALAGELLPFHTNGWPTERSPRKYQFEGLTAARSMSYRCLLTDEMGLGKTSTALWCVGDSKKRRLLVVCPVSVKFNWEAEIKLTLGDDWIPLVVDGTRKARAEQVSQVTSLSTAAAMAGPVACIINYDLLRWLPPEQFKSLQAFATGGFLIFDESHYLKDRTSERSRLSKQLAEQAGCVMALTGTPIRDTAEDIYHQAEVVRPGVWSSFKDFENRHLVIQAVNFANTKRPVRKVVGTKNLDELNRTLNTFQIRRLKKDVLGLPPKVYTFPDLELDEVSAGIYKVMKEFARVEIEKLLQPTEGEGEPPKTIWDPRARSGVEAAMRLEQIAQGFIGGVPEPLMQQLSPALLKNAEKVPGRPNELVIQSSAKLQWLLETIESITLQGGCVLVGSRFNCPMFWLQRELEHRYSINCALIHGGLTAAQRHDAILNLNKSHKVLICQVRIAEGWNATAAQDVLFLGRDWSPAINSQFEDRTHRMGQKGTVNVQIPVVRKTIEVMLHRRLADKQADATQALKDLTLKELLEAL